jgi:hypothetical protein
MKIQLLHQSRADVEAMIESEIAAAYTAMLAREYTKHESRILYGDGSDNVPPGVLDCFGVKREGEE